MLPISKSSLKETNRRRTTDVKSGCPLKRNNNGIQTTCAYIVHNELLGIGVAAGKASGPASIIRHPNEGEKLKEGDVLVAPSTDPGWTPLFLRTAAIVMEEGASLSHGAIVAREYGIPAVVNIPGVLKMIKDHQLITVDGDEGKVYLQ